LREDNTLILVSAEPLDPIACEYVRMGSTYDLRFYLGYADDIDRARRRIYSALPLPSGMPTPIRPTRTERRLISDTVYEVAAPRQGIRTIALPSLEFHPGKEVKALVVKEPSPLETAACPSPLAIHEVKHVAPPQGRRRIPLSSGHLCGFCATTLDLSRAVEVTSIFEKILQTVRFHCDCEGASLLVLTPDGRTLLARHTVGHGPSVGSGSILEGADGTLPALVLKTRTGRIARAGEVQVAGVAICWKGNALGTIQIYNKRGGDFGDDDLEILQLAAAQAAVVLATESAGSAEHNRSA